MARAAQELKLDPKAFRRVMPVLVCSLGLPATLVTIALSNPFDALVYVLLALALAAGWPLAFGSACYLFVLLTRRRALWIEGGDLVALSGQVWRLPLRDIASAVIRRRRGRGGEAIEFTTVDGKRRILISGVFEGRGEAVLGLLGLPLRLREE